MVVTAFGDSSRTRWPASGNVLTVASGRQRTPVRRQRWRDETILVAEITIVGMLTRPSQRGITRSKGCSQNRSAVVRVTAIAVDGEIDVVRVGGQVLGNGVEVVDEATDDFFGFQREQIVHRHFGHLRAGRAAQDEAAQPVLLLDRGSRRGKPPMTARPGSRHRTSPSWSNSSV